MGEEKLSRAVTEKMARKKGGKNVSASAGITSARLYSLSLLTTISDILVRVILGMAMR